MFFVPNQTLRLEPGAPVCCLISGICVAHIQVCFSQIGCQTNVCNHWFDGSGTVSSECELRRMTTVHIALHGWRLLNLAIAYRAWLSTHKQPNTACRHSVTPPDNTMTTQLA